MHSCSMTQSTSADQPVSWTPLTCYTSTLEQRLTNWCERDSLTYQMLADDDDQQQPLKQANLHAEIWKLPSH